MNHKKQRKEDIKNQNTNTKSMKKIQFNIVTKIRIVFVEELVTQQKDEYHHHKSSTPILINTSKAFLSSSSQNPFTHM